jgi:phosphoglycolate phosphatase-like HAD superfamily hydrolase
LIRYRTVLVDLDGTLLDSNDAHARAWMDALGELGYDSSFSRVRRLIGMGGDKILPLLTGLPPDSSRGRTVLERRKRVFLQRYLPTVRPTPGAPELVRRMRADGLTLVAASSAADEELEQLIEAAGVKGLVDTCAGGSGGKRSKPDPDIVRAALACSASAPEESILLGDTPYDLDAAERAAIAMIALRCGGWNDDELAGAVAIYDDPADLLARYDESPVGRNPVRERRTHPGTAAGGVGHGSM